MLATIRIWVLALVVTLAVAGPARAGVAEVTPVIECLKEEICGSVQIGMSASPNPVAPGGTVSFAASSSPVTDCWDNLDHGWWGSVAFTMPVSSSFTWVVYCAGNGIESNSLAVTVSDPGGGGGGGGGGAVPAPINWPSVSGTPETGATLAADRGSWTNTPTAYIYVWRRSGDLAELGRGTSLALASEHVGYQIRVDVQACNGTGCGSWASSGWTATVVEQPPEYDAGYAEGTDTDESGYATLCSGSACSAYLLQSGPNGSSANALCADVWVTVTKSNAVTQIWRMRHSLTFCADRRRITRVWNRVVDGEILIPSWARAVYPWEWSTVTDSAPAVNVSSSRSFARVRFRMCGVFRNLGPLCLINEPWIEIELRGDGTAICSTSAGRVRNCAIRR